MSFNLKNNLKKQAQNYGNQESMLAEKNKENKTVEPDVVTNVQLDDLRKDGDDIILEVKMNKDRKESADTILENRLDTVPKMYNDKRRSEGLSDGQIKPLDVLNEAYSRNKVKKLTEVEKSKSASLDTSFWDEYVGEQHLGPVTKIVSNKQQSQLNNNPDKFKKLDSVEISVKPNVTIDQTLSKKVSFNKEDALKTADAMIYHIYRTAAEAGSDISDIDKQKINDINASKIKILFN